MMEAADQPSESTEAAIVSASGSPGRLFPVAAITTEGRPPDPPLIDVAWGP